MKSQLQISHNSALANSQHDNPQRETVALKTGRAYLAAGEVNKAVQVLSNVFPFFLDIADQRLKFTVTSLLGSVYLKQGKLHLAAAAYHSVLDLVHEQPLDRGLFDFHYGLCSLYYEWNQLEKAKRYLLECLRTIEQRKLPPRWSIKGHLALAWILWAEQNELAALSEMQQASAIAHLAQNHACIKLVNAQQARLWLRQGKLDDAQTWVTTCGLTYIDRVLYPHQSEYLTLLRCLIAQKKIQNALCLLEQLLENALKSGRNSDIIELRTLKALALQTAGNVAEAWIELAQALCLAEREEFIRTFIDEGARLVRLLQSTAAKGVTLLYSKSLLGNLENLPIDLSVMLDDFYATGNSEHLPAVLLSMRERQTLQLVAVGHSNIEIAATLSITPATVKKHLSNVLGKLGAKNRTEAVAKAKSLQII